MKRALTCIMGIVVLGVVLVPAGAQQDIRNKFMIKETLLFGNVDNAYREFWGLWTDSIEIKSKSMSVRDVSEGREAVFQGNVKVNRSDTTLTCDKLVMLVTANRRYFTASGNVKIGGMGPSSNVTIDPSLRFRGRGTAYRFFLRDESDKLFP